MEFAAAQILAHINSSGFLAINVWSIFIPDASGKILTVDGLGLFQQVAWLSISKNIGEK